MLILMPILFYFIQYKPNIMYKTNIKQITIIAITTSSDTYAIFKTIRASLFNEFTSERESSQWAIIFTDICKNAT